MMMWGAHNSRHMAIPPPSSTSTDVAVVSLPGLDDLAWSVCSSGRLSDVREEIMPLDESAQVEVEALNALDC